MSNTSSSPASVARREQLVQLQTFNKVLLQMKSLSQQASFISHMNNSTEGRNYPNMHVKDELVVQPPALVTSARESKLTSILAPIIQGNCRCFMYAYIRDGEDHFHQSMNTMKGIIALTHLCTDSLTKSLRYKSWME